MNHELERQPAAEPHAPMTSERSASPRRGERNVSQMAQSRRASQVGGQGVMAYYQALAARDKQADNIVSEEDAADHCEALAEDARALIQRFVQDVRAGLKPWATQRQQPELRFDDEPLNALYRAFESDWAALPSNRGGLLGSPQSVHSDPLAKAALIRQLNSGYTPQLIKEISCLNLGALIQYVSLLGLETSSIQHRYTLTTQLALSTGGEVVVGLNGSAGLYKVKYENDLQMSWSMSFYCEKIGVSFGQSLSPISVNVETSFGGGAVNGGSAVGAQYLGSSFFHHALVEFGGVEALAGGGYGVGYLTLTDLERSLTFDTSGVVVRFGTDCVGSAGATLGVGRTLPVGDEPEGFVMPPVEDKAMAPVSQQWAPLIQAAVFFPTGASALDDRDLRDIERVVNAIRARYEANPSAGFQIQLIGRASRRWQASGSEADAQEHNLSLATARTSAVRDELNGRLGGLNCQLSTSSQMAEATALSSDPARDSDDAIERSVYIGVFYDACQGFHASIAPQRP
jgi:hypothetical protein